MCEEKITCEHPERLKGRKPGECSSEQISVCHCDVDEHPCESEQECSGLEKCWS